MRSSAIIVIITTHFQTFKTVSVATSLFFKTCTLSEFLSSVDADYLTGKLSTGKEKKAELAYLGRIVRAVQESLRTYTF